MKLETQPISALAKGAILFLLAICFPSEGGEILVAKPKPLILLADRDYPPMAFLEDGIARGMDVDLGKALAAPLNREVRIDLMDWNVAQEKVLKGEADGLLGMSITDERRKQFDFAAPIFTREFGLLVRTGDRTIRGTDDLKGKNVGVTRGGFPREILQTQSGVHLVFIENYPDGFARLGAGTIDAVAADLWVAAYLSEKSGIHNIAIAGKPFATAPAAIAVKKGNPSLVAEINRALNSLRADDKISEIQEHWKPQEILFISRERVRAVVVLSAGIFALVLFAAMGLWIFTLKRQIRIRKGVESALRKSEEKFGTIFRESPVALAVSEFETGRFIEINDALLRLMHGSSFNQMVGRTSLEIGMVTPEERKKIIDDVLKSDGGDRLEIAMHRLDGESFLSELSLSFHELNGKRFLLTNIVDVTERKRAEKELRNSRGDLRALAGRLQAVREEERTRIAREIHDILAQELTRLKIDLGWLSKRLNPSATDFDRQALLEKVAHLTNLTDTTISTVQKIAAELRPVVLDSLGLSAAIEWQAEEFRERTGIACEAIVPEEDFQLPRESATGIFRIVQESLTNVIRHARATRAEIILESHGDQLRLLVQDNGVGFDETDMKDPHSMGLLGMRERAMLLGGRFEISGITGKGTRVSVTMPIENKNVKCDG